MSRVEGSVFITEPEAPARCEDCGKLAELRPYGPGGTRICFECGEKDPEGTERRYRAWCRERGVTHAVNALPGHPEEGEVRVFDPGGETS